MNEDRALERTMDAADAYAERVDRARENEVWRNMRRGERFYPFQPENLQEAISQAEFFQLLPVFEMLEDHSSRSDAGCELLNIAEAYWLKIATADAANRINEPEDD